MYKKKKYKDIRATTPTPAKGVKLLFRIAVTFSSFNQCLNLKSFYSTMNDCKTWKDKSTTTSRRNKEEFQKIIRYQKICE